MPKLGVQDLKLEGKKVLMRVDFNVPLHSDGRIADLTRITESLPSIKWVLKQGGALILMSHLGKPKGRDPRFSLASCADSLSDLLVQPVLMAPDCVGEKVRALAAELKKGEVLLLENLRFHPAEETPDLDPSFGTALASLADCYVNDAFASAHRKHTSIWTVPSLFPERAASGFLMQKEIQFLEGALKDPKRPFYALIGGSKASSKMGILQSLSSKTDGLFIGGALAFTFFKALGLSVGDSLCEKEFVKRAETFMRFCEDKKIPIHLPSDVVIADAFSNEAQVKIISINEGIPPGWRGMDIGPLSCQRWDCILKTAQTVFWNGPLGVCEFARFSHGSYHIARTLAHLKATTLVGGGDSLCAIHQGGLSSQFTHLSTGGGAALEYIELGHLPGIEVLSNKKQQGEWAHNFLTIAK